MTVQTPENHNSLPNILGVLSVDLDLNRGVLALTIDHGMQFLSVSDVKFLKRVCLIVSLRHRLIPLITRHY